jgi:hypothetical protein
MKNKLAFICILLAVIFSSFLGHRSEMVFSDRKSEASRIPTSSEEVIKEYSLGKKKIKIYYQSSHKDWKDKLQGAYCRNNAFNFLKKNEEMAKRVSKIRCHYIHRDEIEKFEVSRSFEESEKQLTLPFSVSKSGQLSMYKTEEIINFLVSDKWQWKEHDNDVLSGVKIRVHASIENSVCLNEILYELENGFHQSGQTEIELREKLASVSFEEIASASKESSSTFYDPLKKTFLVKFKFVDDACQAVGFSEYSKMINTLEFKKREGLSVLAIPTFSFWYDHSLKQKVHSLLSLSEFVDVRLKDYIKSIIVTSDKIKLSSFSYDQKEKAVKIHLQNNAIANEEEMLKGLNALAKKIIADNSLPTPIWIGKHDNAALWTKYTLEAINQYSSTFLSDTLVIKDAKNFCPNYHNFNRNQKRDFWLYFTSVLTKYESNFKPSSRYVEKGKIRGVVSLGLLSMSYKSAKHNYDCDPASAKEADLQKERWNLQCGIKIMKYWLDTEPYFNNGGSDGMSNYYGPLKSHRKELKGIKSFLRQAKPCGLE